MPAFKDLTGQVFGRLTALRIVGRTKWGGAVWLCRCSCNGKEKEIAANSLHQGTTQSCGCLCREIRAAQCGENAANFKHGHCVGLQAGQRCSLTYGSWSAMVNRITQPSHQEYRNYGGAGVTICARWIGEHGFENFLADLGERPEGTTLGRFGDIGDYEPGNVVWQNPKQQAAEQKVKRQLQFIAA